MSEFWREGHWRDRNGDLHWVEGHWVNRSDWSRQSYASYGDEEPAPVIVRSLINPNARCPVCHDSVFYYENDHGSRVYFDTLAPYWDKHPCTDNELWSSSQRPIQETARVLAFRAMANTPHKASSMAIRATSIGAGWLPFRIRHSEEHLVPPLLVVRRVPELGGKRQFLEILGRPTNLEVGRTLFFKDGRISFFDIELFEPAERSARLHARRPTGLSNRQRRMARKGRKATK